MTHAPAYPTGTLCGAEGPTSGELTCTRCAKIIAARVDRVNDLAMPRPHRTARAHALASGPPWTCTCPACRELRAQGFDPFAPPTMGRPATGRPQRKPTGVTLDPQLLERLAQLEARTGLTRSELIRLAIEAYLAREQL